MDIYEVLKSDHENVSNLFHKLEATPADGAVTRQQLFEEIQADLEVHSQAEEDVFYAALKNHPETRDAAQHSAKEHRNIDQLLAELSSMSTESAGWNTKIAKLKETVTHHVHEEETNIFAQAHKVFSQDQAAEMGKRMADEKGRLTRK